MATSIASPRPQARLLMSFSRAMHHPLPYLILTVTFGIRPTTYLLTSTTTTFVESSAGVSEGGRTGLSAIVTGLMFLIAIFLSPIFIAIPGFATAPALIFVGFLMITAVVDIDFNDLTEAIPAYLALVAMPILYSISDGIAVGVISYVVINACCGKAKKISPLMYVLAVLFVLKYVFL